MRNAHLVSGKRPQNVLGEIIVPIATFQDDSIIKTIIFPSKSS